MCGIVGAAGQLNQKHERAFKTMLILDSLRGIDSTGVLVVHRDGSCDLPKAVGNPFYLLESRVLAKAMEGFHSILLGHNRYATQGKVNIRNAHPFEFDTVVGVHNGTLKNKYALEDGHKFDVDSEAFYNHIDKHGVEDAVHKLDGAWAIVWYNKDEGTLNMLRNSERPLYVSVTKEGQLFWASEAWMIEVALNREQIEFSDPELIPVDTWHKIQVFNDGTLGKPHVVPLASRFRPPVQTGHWVNGSYFPTQTPIQKAAQTAPAGTGSGVQQQSSGSNAITYNNTSNPYAKGEEVKMLVYGEGTDQSGARYYLCKDSANPTVSIRLFINQADRVDLMNKYIIGEMHTYSIRDRIGLYYKVVHSTVRLFTEGKNVEENKEDSNAGRFFHDDKGRLIPELEWNKKHGTCAWCQGHVNPTLNFKFTQEGDAICHECVEHDEDVKSLVKFK